MAYNDYSAEDLAADSAFRQWVLQPDPASDRYWANVLEEEPQLAEKVARATRLVRQLNQATTPELSAADAVQLEKIWQNLRVNAAQDTHPSTPVGRTVRFMPFWGRWVAAAMVVLALGVGWWWSNQQLITGPFGANSSLSNSTEPQQEQVNRTTKPMLVQLSDGSSVQLQPNSRLSYPRQFTAAKREVRLVGEAFFEVTKNPARPFLVYAAETVTKVVGTSFRVRAYEQDKTVSVVVRTGRVSVFSRQNFDRTAKAPNTQVAGVLLTPNQRATFDRASEQLARDLVEQPLPLPSVPTQEELVFDDRPVGEVLTALEKLYGLDIVFDDQLLRDCPITTTLSGSEGLYQRLNRICQAIGATYEVVDGQLIITSTGCTSVP